MHTPFVGAYWPARKETKEQCALRIESFIQRVQTYPDFSQWFSKRRSAKAAAKKIVPTTAEGILPFLKSNNRDTDGSPIAELGFNLDLWNGDSVSLSITCGAYSPVIRNSLVVTLPTIDEVAPRDLETMRSLLEAIIDVWAPESGAATSPQLIAENGGGMPWQTKGWFNYRKGEGLTSSCSFK